MFVIFQCLAILIAALHIWIMILEMFLWTKPIGRKAFRMTQEKAESSKVLAANQGLYNGFLAAGIFWGLLRQDSGVVDFFLVCIAVAGLYGGMTAGRKIIFIQTIPAFLTLFVGYLAK